MKFKRVEKDNLHGCYSRTEAEPKWLFGPNPTPAGLGGQAQAHTSDLHGTAETEILGGDRQPQPGRDWLLSSPQGALLVQLNEMEKATRRRLVGRIRAQETRLFSSSSRGKAHVRARARTSTRACEARSSREDYRRPKKTLRTVRGGSGEEGRPGLIACITQLSVFVGVLASCEAVGFSRASYYRAIAEQPTQLSPGPAGNDPAPATAEHGPATATTPVEADLICEPASEDHFVTPGAPFLTPVPPGEPTLASHARALTAVERQLILDALHSERFVDRAPAEVYHTLLDEGIYLGSVRTYYRVLAENLEVKERRAQRRHPEYAKPELIATGPNQVWTWDITKLLGPAKWTYYYLYVILDIFSRYVVGWMLAEREASIWAQQLIEETCEKQNIKPGQLTMHSDNGAPMQATPMVGLHARLDITKTNSRPHVSNDNPFSESQFKTMKYSPGFPRRFQGGFEEASEFCKGFFPWYCREHRHSGIAFLTPEMVHYGLADQALAGRHMRLLQAYNTHPQRFIQGPPKLNQLDRAVYINPPQKGEALAAGGFQVH